MAVYLNQAHRSFQRVTVHTVPYDLPEGYSRSVGYIGSGTYGHVLRTVATKSSGSQLEVAIKKLKDPLLSERLAQVCFRELKLLQNLHHPNIARLVDIYTTANNARELDDVFLVMEFVGSSIEVHLQESIRAKYAHLPMSIIPRIIRDTLSALKYLAHANVLHRDLKPSNLAVNGRGKTVLIDYGLARTGITEDNSSALTQGACTPVYGAPEMIFWEQCSYGKEADIWSLGCILAELLTWKTLFIDPRSKVSLYISMFGQISEQFLSKVRNNDGTKKHMATKNTEVQRSDLFAYFSTWNKVANYNNSKDQSAIDLIYRCVQYDPDARITIDAALQHPFLADIHEPEDYSHVQPLVYDDSQRSLEQWKQTVFGEIWNFPAREDTPRSARH